MIAVGVDVGKSFLDVAVHGEQGVQRFTNPSGGVGRLVKQLVERVTRLLLAVKSRDRTHKLNTRPRKRHGYLSPLQIIP